MAATHTFDSQQITPGQGSASASIANQANASQSISSVLFRTWLGLGLVLNLPWGHAELAIGPLWLWLVVIPMLGVAASLAAQRKLRWFSPVLHSARNRRPQARRRSAL